MLTARAFDNSPAIAAMVERGRRRPTSIYSRFSPLTINKNLVNDTPKRGDRWSPPALRCGTTPMIIPSIKPCKTSVFFGNISLVPEKKLNPFKPFAARFVEVSESEKAIVARLLVKKARETLHEGNIKEAAQICQAVESLQAKQPSYISKIFMDCAEILMEGKSIKKALAFAEKATSLNSFDANLWQRRGQIELLAGNKGAAIISFERAVKLSPNSKEAKRLLLRARLRQTSSVRSIDNQNGIVTKGSQKLREDDMLMESALLLLEQGKKAAAVDVASKSKKLGPLVKLIGRSGILSILQQELTPEKN